MQKEIKREISITADGSTTIHLPELDEHYHSKHGAINEANHVFIQNGLYHILKSRTFKSLNILEIGFGTGLNALITLIEAKKKEQTVNYVGVEAYPIAAKEVQQMNYPRALGNIEAEPIFQELHTSNWETNIPVTDIFTLQKRKQFFSDIEDKNSFDLVYFDAFGARVQPELWTVVIFKKMFEALNKGGVLVTYSAKGSVRRAMLEVGFEVERLPGPPGKREMLRATKP